MKSNIKYSIYEFLSSVLFFTFSLTGFVILIINKNWASVLFGFFLCCASFMLFNSINSIQWFRINDGYIKVYSLFGVIKNVKLRQIKRAFIMNTRIFGFKWSIYREHIVLCLIKSVKKAEIYDAYNSKKNKYIIVPYTSETERLIKEEYKKSCGNELLIK